MNPAVGGMRRVRRSAPPPCRGHVFLPHGAWPGELLPPGGAWYIQRMSGGQHLVGGGGGASPDPGCRADRRRAGAALALVTALGLLLRLYRLPGQSVWHDEFLALCHFNAPDLSRHLALLDLYMPINMKSPLYYAFQYGFARHVTDSLLALRLLAVLFGVLCIPVLYALVHRMFGRRPALFAALLLALSPQHVWYSQEVRTYAFSMLLSLCSFYCLLRAVEGGGRRWWAASLLLNALLPWTHLMFSLTVFAEGCFLLWWWRRTPVQTVVWALAQSALMTPMVLHLFPLPFSQDAESPVGMGGILSAFFAVDSVGLYGDLLPSWKADPGSAPAWTAFLLAFRKPADLALGAFFAAVLAAAGFGVRRGGGVSRGVVFSLCVWLAPPALLAALNLATDKPFLSQMYYMYAMAGAYALAAWAVCALPRPVLRRVIGAAVAGVYAFNLALLVPFTTRTDWKGVADHIVRHREPRDVVVNFEFYGPANPLECYRDAIGLPVMRANTVAAVCAAVPELFAPAGQAPPARVWVVYRGLFRETLFSGEDTAGVLRERLAACGIGLEPHFFPGLYNVTLLETYVLPGRMPMPCAELSATDDRGHRELLGALGIRFAGQAEEDASLRVLCRVIGATWADLPPVIWATYVLDLVAADRPDLAEAVARWQIGRVPKASPLHFALGAALFAQGRVSEAGESFEAAYGHQPSLRLLTAPLVGHLLRGDRAAARAELERMRPWGWAYYIPVFDHLLAENARPARPPEG